MHEFKAIWPFKIKMSNFKAYLGTSRLEVEKIIGINFFKNEIENESHHYPKKKSADNFEEKKRSNTSINLINSKDHISLGTNQ